MDSPEAVFRESGDGDFASPASFSSPTGAGPTAVSRESVTVSSSVKRLPVGDKLESRAASSGGAWGRRLGRGQARVVGLSSSLGAVVSGVEEENATEFGGEGWGVGGGRRGSVCPSRRTIIEVGSLDWRGNFAGSAGVYFVGMAIVFFCGMQFYQRGKDGLPLQLGYTILEGLPYCR